MDSFCGSCGTRNEDGAFCFNCGQPLGGTGGSPESSSPEPDPTLQLPSAPSATAAPAGPPPPAGYPTAPPPFTPPPSAPPAQPGYSHLPPPPGAYPTGRPTAPKVNPFVGWPVSDYLRDAGAAFCLFACLGMWWEISPDPNGGEQWWVVISVLLSVASLATPYLARAGVVPGWSPLHWRLVKAAANLPFLASVLAAVVNELVHVGDDFEGGIGAGVGMGLAGVALALQPREADDPMHTEDRYWNAAAAASAFGAVVLALLMFAGFLVDTDDLFDEPLAFFALLVVTVGMLLAVMGWPMAGYLSGSASGRRVFSTATFTLLGTALFAHADDGGALFYWPQVEKWYGGATGFGGIGIGGTLLIGVAAGLSVARSLARRPSEQTEPVGEWTKTASTALLVSVAGSAVALLALIIGIVEDSDDLASAIVVGVLIVAVAGTAGFASTLLSDPRKNRLLVLGLVAGTVVLGFVAMGVVNGNDLNIEALGSGPSVPVTGWVVAAWLTLPLLAAYALTVPAPVRASLGPLVPQQPSYPGGMPPGYPQGHPQQPGYPQGHPQQPPPYPGQQPPYPPQ